MGGGDVIFLSMSLVEFVERLKNSVRIRSNGGGGRNDGARGIDGEVGVRAR